MRSATITRFRPRRDVTLALVAALSCGFAGALIAIAGTLQFVVPHLCGAIPADAIAQIIFPPLS